MILINFFFKAFCSLDLHERIMITPLFKLAKTYSLHVILQSCLVTVEFLIDKPQNLDF